MGKIVVSDNITVDGVVQDPTGEEGFERGGWFAQVSGSDREAFAKAALDEALAADAFLIGRRTYEFLAARWPSRTGALADRLNSFPKYVVSSTLENPEWNNTRVLKGNPAAEASQLTRKVKGEIVIPASFQLVHALIEHDLVDEVRVMIYPFVLGAGNRLFSGSIAKVPLQLVQNRTIGDGLAHITYRVVRTA